MFTYTEHYVKVILKNSFLLCKVLYYPHMDDIAALTVKARVNELLEKRGWKQKDLAKKMKVKPSAISRMLSGRTLGTDSLTRLSAALGVPVADLFQGEPAELKPNGRKLKK